ncbi:hypothetical protein TcasGA2_TC001721 [Tribolium castaneum]|uniref:Uncharacterized protein n=1 Tax=Tribolium castaneum TaxID=7070 RepID=D6W889_TRICA|nr:hypothetical protein TcasGA2_TC001721 [Tribolium castaneum]
MLVWKGEENIFPKYTNKNEDKLYSAVPKEADDPFSLLEKTHKNSKEVETTNDDNDETVKDEEDRAVENWKGKGATKPKRPRRSYLENQKEWEFMELSARTKTIPISLIKNGNCFTLRTITINKKKFMFTNTCGFDALVRICLHVTVTAPHLERVL